MPPSGVYQNKLVHVADFQEAYNDVEKILTNQNKPLLRKICVGFEALTNALESREPGIFKITIEWFRLYLKLLMSIDPLNEKFLKRFERTIPAAISHIIGCLQHKTKEILNYHCSLLNVIEEIIENVKPCIITDIVKLETGTIASLWKPIDYAVDFNTQLKTLKILALFLKHLDNEQQNEELKSIKWTNLSLFEDKLKTIVQAAKSANILENSARELLNNYNMNLSRKKLVYSLYCKSLVLGNKFKFYQTLNMDKFWIDMNYCPKTLSFQGRFKLDSSSKIEIVTVIVKVQKMELKNNNLLIHFCQPEFSKYSHHFSAISERVIQLTLSQEEEKRLRENYIVLDYFNQAQMQNNSNELNDHKKETPKPSSEMLIDSFPNVNNEATISNTFNLIDPLEVTHPLDVLETPKTSRINKKSSEKCPKGKNNESLEEHPIRSLRPKRKLFFSNLEDVISDEESKKPSKKRPRTRKPRSTKTNKKVGKVLPAVNLTHNNAAKSTMNIVDLTDNLNNGVERCIRTTSSNVLTSQQCSEILKSVSDIYNVGDISYAEPCQSYRSFKTITIPQPVHNVIKSNNTKERKKKLDVENKKTNKLVDIKKEHRDNISLNKENVFPGASNNKRRISPQLFGSQSSNEVPPEKKSKSTQKAHGVYATNIEIDLTSDIESGPHKESQRKFLKTISSNENKNIINEPLLDTFDLELVRTDEQSTKTPTPYCTPNIINYITTPASTSAMNISDINDSDVELIPLSKTPNFNMDKYRNEELRKNVVDEILNDWNTHLDDNESTHNVKDDEHKTSSTLDLNNIDEIFDVKKCVNKSVQPNVVGEFLHDCNTSGNKIQSIHEVQANKNVLNTNLNITFEDIKSAQKVENKQHELNIVANNFDENVYLKKSVVLQTRDDIEDSDSSEDNYNEDNCDNLMKTSLNFLKDPDLRINEDIVIMQHMSSNINQIHYNEDLMWNTPATNCIILRNVSTKTTTKCQVTPNAVITRQTHVCTKEAVINADTKQKISYKGLKARKALINLYNKAAIDKKPQSSVKIIHENIATGNKIFPIENNNIIKNNQNNISTTLIPLNNTNLIAINKNPMFSSTLTNKNVKQNDINSSLPTKFCQYNTITTSVPTENNNLIVTNKNILNEINENHMSSVSINDNCNCTFKPSASSTIQSANIDFKTENGNAHDVQTEERLNLQDIENANSFINTSPTLSEALEYGKDIFKNDVSKLVNIYEAKIKLRLEDARRQHLTNAYDMYKQKLCEITKSILQKSEEQKTELVLLRKNIEDLVTQMECQYQTFVEKSKEFNSYQETMERALDALEEMDIKNRITTEYNNLLNQVNSDEEEVIQEIWSDYLNERFKKFHNSMEKFSKI